MLSENQTENDQPDLHVLLAQLDYEMADKAMEASYLAIPMFVHRMHEIREREQRSITMQRR